MNDELKPCPFCGGMNLYYTAGRFYGVECSDCGAKVVGAFRTEEEAVEAWNRRVQPTFTPDELKEIRLMFDFGVHKLPDSRWVEICQSIVDKCDAMLKREER